MLLPLIVVCLTGPQTSPPVPPYRRVTSVSLPDQMSEDAWCVSGSTVVVGSNQLIAYALPSMRKVWTYVPKQKGRAIRIVAEGGNGFANFQEDKSGFLMSFDVATGKPRWTKPTDRSQSALATLNGDIYAFLKGYELSKIDAKTGAVKWTDAFSSRSEQVEYLLPTAKALIFDLNQITQAIDPSTGKHLWEVEDSNASRPLVATENVVWVPLSEGSAAIEISTGKTLWKSPKAYEAGAVEISGSFIASEIGKLRGVSAATGAELWSISDGKRTSTPAEITSPSSVPKCSRCPATKWCSPIKMAIQFGGFQRENLSSARSGRTENQFSLWDKAR
ncbi:hypothetical protein BH11ARM1_BH11ARM1_01150 [soil metagenome]